VVTQPTVSFYDVFLVWSFPFFRGLAFSSTLFLSFRKAHYAPSPDSSTGESPIGCPRIVDEFSRPGRVENTEVLFSTVRSPPPELLLAPPWPPLARARSWRNLALSLRILWRRVAPSPTHILRRF